MQTHNRTSCDFRVHLSYLELLDDLHLRMKRHSIFHATVACENLDSWLHSGIHMCMRHAMQRYVPIDSRMQLTVPTALHVPAAQNALQAQQLLLAIICAWKSPEYAHGERATDVTLVHAANVRDYWSGGDAVK